MTLFLAICLGIGLALAVGLRPFLPALLACALARGDAGIDFDHTNVAFMEKPAFLLALLIGVVVLIVDRAPPSAGGRLQRPVRRGGCGHRARARRAAVRRRACGRPLRVRRRADRRHRLRGARRGGRARLLREHAQTARQRGGGDAAGLRRGRRARARRPVGARAAGLARRARVPRLAAARAAQTRRAQVRGPAHIAVSGASEPAAAPRKLVLTVIDGLKPAMLERAVQQGRAPILQAIMERGAYVDDCVAAFPSVTPVCAASIATGVGPDRHRIPSMNWYDRGEQRYVEYGSSFGASRRAGVLRSLTDTVYNMNGKHLAPEVPTVFERLDDAGLRTAGTTYLIYRGRHRHQLAGETALARIAGAVFRDSGDGPARAVLRGPVREPAHRLPRPARDARPARPAQRLRRRLPGRAGPVRLPALLAARQRRLLAPQRPARAGHLDRGGRPPARAARARGRRPRALPRASTR